jgi:hypothetical protein
VDDRMSDRCNFYRSAISIIPMTHLYISSHCTGIMRGAVLRVLRSRFAPRISRLCTVAGSTERCGCSPCLSLVFPLVFSPPCVSATLLPGADLADSKVFTFYRPAHRLRHQREPPLRTVGWLTMCLEGKTSAARLAGRCAVRNGKS